MMISAVAIFCEDIREEKSGQDTIVGVLPDNLVVQSLLSPAAPNMARMLPRLCLYMRVHIPSQSQPKEVYATLTDPEGTIITRNEWPHDQIAKTFSDTRANGSPLAGLILKIVASPFPVVTFGRIVAKAVVDGTEYVAGALNLINSDATASPPPA